MDNFTVCVLTGTDGAPLLLTRTLAARVGIIRGDSYRGTTLRLENEADGPAFLTVQEDIRTVVHRLARAVDGCPDVPLFDAVFPSSEPAPLSPKSDAAFLAKRLRRVARLVGLNYDGMTDENVTAVAGTILGEIARKLARKARDRAEAPSDE